MKKISVIFLVLFCLIITGCTSNKSKDVKSLSDFENVCVSNNFSVSDNMKEYSDVDYVSDAKAATNDNIKIQMVVYDNSEDAQKVLEDHISTFMTMKGSGSVINNDKGKNYYHFDMISNGYYMVSSRTNNTLMFVKTPVSNKELIDKIFNELGY